jgi:lipoprotein NlpD
LWLPLCQPDRGEWMERIAVTSKQQVKDCFRFSYRCFACALCFLFVFLAISCSAPHVQKEQPKGVYHRVKKGETFYGIARAYQVKLQDLAQANNITDPFLIKEDMVIFIPNVSAIIDDVMPRVKKAETELGANNGKDSASGTPVPPVSGQPSVVFPKTEKQSPGKLSVSSELDSEAGSRQKQPQGTAAPEAKTKKPTEENGEILAGKKTFIWPVRGSVKTRFGIQPNKTFYNWVKIVSLRGASVKAAASGVVIFSAPLKDFGETVIIRHENNYTTVYTHLKKRYVKTDQSVKKGEVIAMVGEIDEMGDAYINFEIRFKGKARNPLFFLPYAR